MSLARSNALHSAQKPAVPSTHQMFGLDLSAADALSTQPEIGWRFKPTASCVGNCRNSVEPPKKVQKRTIYVSFCVISIPNSGT
jgi:hypothetical protein